MYSPLTHMHTTRIQIYYSVLCFWQETPSYLTNCLFTLSRDIIPNYLPTNGCSKTNTFGVGCGLEQACRYLTYIT
jgi:hypothetical protein